MNISWNCLDRHLIGPRRNKAALIWEGENGDVRTLTYLQLHREVCKFANCLRDLGVAKGDRVAIYMPLLLETAIAMLACARIGAIHNVVFGGFSPDALADRINDSGCKVLITADGGWRRGTSSRSKHNADRALETCPSVEHVIIVKQPPRGSPPAAHHRGEGPLVPSHDGPPEGGLPRRARWIPMTRCSSSIPRAPRESRRALCTRQEATWWGCTPRRATSSISKKRTFSGAPRTSAG